MIQAAPALSRGATHPGEAGIRIPARHMVRFHAAATLAWIALIPPTLLWWRESLLWIALMSAYANVAGHWAAWQASRAEATGDT